MNENTAITNDEFGDFILLESAPKFHRFKTNDMLIYEYITIRNISGETSIESAKESLRAYLAYFGKNLRKEK